MFIAALDKGGLDRVSRVASELTSVSLADALRIVVLIREQEPANYAKACLKWLARCSSEKAVTISDVVDAAEGLESLDDVPQAGLERLRQLCS